MEAPHQRQAVSVTQSRSLSLKRIYVDAYSCPPGPAKAPPAARLHRSVTADARDSSAGRRRLDSRAEARGFCILAFKDGDTVRLWSRNGRDWSAEFLAITEAVIALPFLGSL